MTILAGIDGVVKLGSNTIAQIKSFSIEIQRETMDSTTMGNEGWRTYHPILKTWSGSLDAFWDKTDTTGQMLLKSNENVELGFYVEGGNTGDSYLTGNAIISSISRQASVDGIVEVSFSFQGNGKLEEKTIT